MDELIRKTDAIDAVCTDCCGGNHDHDCRFYPDCDNLKSIKAIPPVQPTLMRSIGKLVGYTGNKCPNCGRLRVERYESGLEICEKCNWCEQTKSYWLDWEEG